MSKLVQGQDRDSTPGRLVTPRSPARAAVLSVVTLTLYGLLVVVEAQQ